MQEPIEFVYWLKNENVGHCLNMWDVEQKLCSVFLRILIWSVWSKHSVQGKEAQQKKDFLQKIHWGNTIL